MTAKIQVPDMTCEHCQEKIMAALKHARINAWVDLEKKTVMVEEVDLALARKAIESAGYTPRV